MHYPPIVVAATIAHDLVRRLYDCCFILGFFPSTEDISDVPDTLRDWGWGRMNASRATCASLFPRSWLVYNEVVPGLRLCCRQVSPVWPHEYRETSLPACVFVWTAENVCEY